MSGGSPPSHILRDSSHKNPFAGSVGRVTVDRATHTRTPPATVPYLLPATDTTAPSTSVLPATGSERATSTFSATFSATKTAT